jgi:alpha-tubulin suppressor-like RCC1 family protein
VASISVGGDHILMIDVDNQLWGLGDNTNGCLGMGGDKYRKTPQRAVAFENKRVIDIACGHFFSVIIAECFTITSQK